MAPDHFLEIVFDSGQVHKRIEFGPEAAGPCSLVVRGRRNESLERPAKATKGHAQLSKGSNSISILLISQSLVLSGRTTEVHENPGEVGPSLLCSVTSYSS